jgi:hypothetical protein
MKIDIKSLLVGAVLAAVVFFGTGAAGNESPRYQIQGAAHNCAFRLEVNSGAVLQWNGLSWKDITPPK